MEGVSSIHLCLSYGCSIPAPYSPVDFFYATPLVSIFPKAVDTPTPSVTGPVRSAHGDIVWWTCSSCHSLIRMTTFSAPSSFSFRCIRPASPVFGLRRRSVPARSVSPPTGCQTVPLLTLSLFPQPGPHMNFAFRVTLLSLLSLRSKIPCFCRRIPPRKHYTSATPVHHPTLPFS